MVQVLVLILHRVFFSGENTLIAVSFRSFQFAIWPPGQMADKQEQKIMEKYASKKIYMERRLGKPNLREP